MVVVQRGLQEASYLQPARRLYIVLERLESFTFLKHGAAIWNVWVDRWNWPLSLSLQLGIESGSHVHKKPELIAEVPHTWPPLWVGASALYCHGARLPW